MIPAHLKQEMAQDAARATPLAVYFGSLLNGVDWPTVAALLAAVYTLILIAEKVWKGLLKPMFRRPAVRTAQDE